MTSKNLPLPASAPAALEILEFDRGFAIRLYGLTRLTVSGRAAALETPESLLSSGLALWDDPEERAAAEDQARRLGLIS